MREYVNVRDGKRPAEQLVSGVLNKQKLMVNERGTERLVTLLWMCVRGSSLQAYAVCGVRERTRLKIDSTCVEERLECVTAAIRYCFLLRAHQECVCVFLVFVRCSKQFVLATI